MRRAIALGALAIAGTLAAQTMPGPSRLARGYLAEPAPVDSILLSPAPPAAGSPAEARDVAAAQAALGLAGGPRWSLATKDADLFAPDVTAAFSCAAGREIGATATPATNRLLRRTLADFGLSTSAIKRKFQRSRPFMANGRPSCTPAAEPMLKSDGSYPSGHSAIGYGWGLILAELVPDRADALVARGRAFGDSRRVCNAHWLSDTEEGRIAGAAVLARLHADAAFRADLDAARSELLAVRAVPPTHDCAAESAALDLTR
ncbi:phosphatase PAP2 family protein [Sphingomonas ginsenosidivorax]|uniref:Acid phosphatase n=1 Tax=Sphingomonas ginsenosidivorax TaxID=862135 RepID=A0A5C6UDQ8_9SPHN|nr:phosphatase PAP2 family protein [Sphingomonas ginsenosidivorax]TXC70266.1 phosphatase PAP2 family protein [Sphingomonas ginsenosidivorax]